MNEIAWSLIDRKFLSKCPCAYNLNKCHFLTIVTELITTYIVFDIQEFLECRMLELILEMKLSLWNTCTYVFVHYKEHMPEKKALNFTFSNLLSICTFGTYFILMVFLLPIQQIFTRQVPLV